MNSDLKRKKQSDLRDVETKNTVEGKVVGSKSK
jgi:hypothetical protein